MIAGLQLQAEWIAIVLGVALIGGLVWAACDWAIGLLTTRRKPSLPAYQPAVDPIDRRVMHGLVDFERRRQQLRRRAS